MNILTEPELLARLNSAPGVTISRSTFVQSLRPLLVERGDARQLGTGKRAVWAYDEDAAWMWREYLAVRAELIRRGTPEWHSKRAYSVRDMEDIVLVGMYSDVTDAVYPPAGVGEVGI